MSDPSPPGVFPSSLVLVTGINGHVASTIVRRLLEKGYHVRGTVRALRSAEVVKKALAQFGNGFQVVEISDVCAAGAFDVVMKDVDAVIHTASPTALNSKRPEEQYVPAVDGTLNILRSARSTPSVKRFLWMGSIASVIYTAKDPYTEVITRDDWNVQTEEIVKNLQPDDPLAGTHIYIGSKVVAERAAWAFMEEEKPAFSLTTVLGALQIGPVFKAVPNVERMGVSLKAFYGTFADPPLKTSLSTSQEVAWCHVLNLADLFLASLTSPKTPKKRLIGCAGRTSNARIAEIVREVFPDRPFPPVQDSQDPAKWRGHGADAIRFDTALEEELLGGRWRTLEDAVVTCAKDLIAKEIKGWDNGITL